jgi:hypothetical protein
MVYVSPYQVLPRVVVGEGVQVSLTNLPTKNGTHMVYVSPYQVLPRVVVGEGVHSRVTLHVTSHLS